MQEVRITQTPSGAVIATSSADVPETRAELEVLGLKRIELQDQIANLRRRKNTLSEDWHRASGSGRVAIQERMDAVDQTVARLESSLDQINASIAAAPPSALTATSVARQDPADVFLNRVSNDLVPIVAILSVFVFAPFAIAISRFLWKRASAPPQRVLLGEQAALQRLDQLQQSVDAMAIEVERISEGQRFVAKLMHEKDEAAAHARLPGNAR